MSIAHWLIILSALISIIGAYAYIRDTFKGKSKPNRVTWSMWALASLTGASAAFFGGADIWVTVRIFLAGLIPLLVFIASFLNSKSYWKLTTFDLTCGVCSVSALILWGITSSTSLAILLAAIGDGFATIPTILKAWKYPETETGLTYLAGFISVLLVIPSIPKWNIENSAFQIYLLIANTLLLFIVYRKKLSSFSSLFK